ncbi:hypothetical protein BD770DRAFT_414405 [Pilaira anomala]|nr:hypothetical protein BD770DRAFT_414405 [Pilaira anomala]
MSKLRVEKIYLLGWSFLSCQESLGHISLTDDYVIGTYTSCGLCFYWNLAAFDRQRCGSLTIVNGTFHIIFNPLSVMERHKRISCADIRARLVLYIPESLTEWFLLLVNVAVALELEKLTGTWFNFFFRKYECFTPRRYRKSGPFYSLRSTFLQDFVLLCH